VTGLAERLRDAAALTEQAAVGSQHAELAGPRADPAVIGALQLAADTLYHAAEVLGPPPVPSRRTLTMSALTMGGWAVFCVAVLLAVPDPAQPRVLAATIAGGVVFAMLLADLVAAVWDRYSIRTLASGLASGVQARTVDDVIATVRARIAEITASLETDRDDTHLAVGQQIE
jgi:hypothetical protein